MSKHFFWLTQAQFAKIKPQLPTDARGVALAERVARSVWTAQDAL